MSRSLVTELAARLNILWAEDGLRAKELWLRPDKYHKLEMELMSDPGANAGMTVYGDAKTTQIAIRGGFGETVVRRDKDTCRHCGQEVKHV